MTKIFISKNAPKPVGKYPHAIEVKMYYIYLELVPEIIRIIQFGKSI